MKWIKYEQATNTIIISAATAARKNELFPTKMNYWSVTQITNEIDLKILNDLMTKHIVNGEDFNRLKSMG